MDLAAARARYRGAEGFRLGDRPASGFEPGIEMVPERFRMVEDLR